MVEFDEAKHIYTLDGKVLPGVTTVLGVVKVDALTNWKINKICDTTIKHYYKNPLLSIEDAVEYGKGEPERILVKAGDKGTEAHKQLELWVKGEEYDDRNHCVQKVAEWLSGMEVEWLLSEKLVYSPTFRYAGTFDGLARINGRITLIDFKTSNRLYPKFLDQCAAYAVALKEITGVPVDDMLVIRLPKTSRGKLEILKTTTPREIDEHFQRFEACLRVYNTHPEARSR